MYLKSGFLFVVLIALSFANDEFEDEFTVKLNDSNFNELIKTTNFFVKFYAPWCGHCRKLAPTWSELAELLNGDDDSRVKIAKVDCTENNKVCTDNDITSYPTLKFFHINSVDEPVRYRGSRDLPSLTQFINDQLGSSLAEESPDVPAPVNSLVELNDLTFNVHVSKGKHFVKFYAPWCGHCQKLAPTWEELAKSLEHEKSVSIAKIDCTEYRSICQDFEVKGYPTLLWIEDGKKIEKYSGSRSHDDLKAYVDKMLGTKPTKAENDSADGDVSTVVQLTAQSFDHGTEKGVTFVKFFAPWCGHCKRLAPVWKNLSEKFLGTPNVKIAQVDCTLSENKDLCTTQEVNGFPTLFIYKNGERIAEYNGSRSLEDLYDFVNRYATDSSHDEL
jgi:thioredoxin domain-containing protein 5